MTMENNELLDKILELEKENKIVFMTIEGAMTASIESIIKQPVEGLLYDLNRDKATLMSLSKSKSQRWVNDMAIVNVLKYVLEENEKLHKTIDDLKLEFGEFAKNPFKDINNLGGGKPIPTSKSPSIEKTNKGADTVVPGFNTNLSISL